MPDGADAKPSGTKITKTHSVLRQRRDVRFSTVYKRKFDAEKTALAVALSVDNSISTHRKIGAKIFFLAGSLIFYRLLTYFRE